MYPYRYLWFDSKANSKTKEKNKYIHGFIKDKGFKVKHNEFEELTDWSSDNIQFLI